MHRWKDRSSIVAGGRRRVRVQDSLGISGAGSFSPRRFGISPVGGRVKGDFCNLHRWCP